MAKDKAVFDKKGKHRAKMLNEQAISLGLVPYFSPDTISAAEKLAVEPGLLD